MKNLVLSAVVVTLATLALHFGCVEFGLDPEKATIITFLALFGALAAVQGVTFFTKFKVPLEAFMVTTFTAIAAVFATEGAGGFYIDIGIVLCIALFVGFLKKETGQSFQKIVPVLLVEGASIIIPIYLHGTSG